MKTTTKLFTVLALASGGTALADPPRTPRTPAPAPASVAAHVQPSRTPIAPPGTRPTTAISITPAPAMMVRTLRNGRPACGNVASKGPRRPCPPPAVQTAVPPTVPRAGATR